MASRRRSRGRADSRTLGTLLVLGVGGYAAYSIYQSMQPNSPVFQSTKPSQVNYAASALTGAGIPSQISTDGTQVLVSSGNLNAAGNIIAAITPSLPTT